MPTYGRSVVVEKMKSWLGRKEINGSHKAIIDIYNTLKPLPANYKVKYTDAWCATAYSAAFKAVGYEDICPCECSCARMIKKAIKMGIWVENDTYVPSPGDGVLYDWDDNGVGDNTGNPEHVGMVVKVSGNNLTIIEGNCSDSVKERKIKINNRYIRGYVTPKFTTQTVTHEKPKNPYKRTVNLIKKGMKGESVKWLQWWLNQYGHGLVLDGDYGRLTYTALIDFQQKHTYQGQKLVVDGLCGQKTIWALENSQTVV